MRVLRRSALVVFTFALTLAIFCDVVFALGLLVHLISGGLRGMNDWIVHVSTEGRLEFPSYASIYGRFVGACAFLLLVTVGSWWGRRILKAKAQLER